MDRKPALFLGSAFVLFGLVAGSACSTPQATDAGSKRGSHAQAQSRPLPPHPAQGGAALLEGREGTDFREIQNLYSKGLYEEANQKLTTFEKKYPRSEQMAHARNLHGMAFLLSRRPQQAVFQFRKAIEACEVHGFRQYLFYNLAAAQFDAGQFEDAQQSLGDIAPEGLDRDTRFKFHALRARLFQKQGATLDLIREQIALAGLVDGEAAAPVLASLSQTLAGVNDPLLLETLLKDYKDSPAVDLILFRLGQQQLVSGQAEAGQARLRELLARFPRSSKYAEANELVARTTSQAEVDPHAVGVLIPMTGKFAQFGQQTLQAIQLAFRIFNSEEPDNKLVLIVEDSGDDPDQALRGLNDLVFKHHVAAVIGPLASKGVDQITQRAEELGVPILTLSQQPGASGEYVFPAGLTMKLQATEIARHAMERLGLKRFAIVHPRDKFGEQLSTAFWDAVETLGGEVVGVESYTPGETDFRQPIDKLSGLHYTDARSRELEALAKERETNNIKKRNRKTEKFFSLTPVADYDAVFVADEPKVAAQVIPTFAYRDVDHVQFLGTASWHSPELAERAGPSANGACFVDAFYAENPSPSVKKFLTRFKDTFGQEPGAIEAIAYDAARVLEHAMVGTKTRSEVRDEIRRITNFSGVTGRISYRNGHLTRNLAVLTFRNGKIESFE